jgi:SAM-dependent methyltransferase
MIRVKIKLRMLIRELILKLGSVFFESNPILNPLSGDRCIEYGFVIKNLIGLDRSRYRSVLDIGCYASPLTTIIRELGFAVDGVDLLPSPYIYQGVNHLQGDFLSLDFKVSYDVVVLCSTIEHIGLGGRYGSRNIEDGDMKAIEKVKQLLNTQGILILTVPYGKEKTIKPLHRVYNKSSRLLRYAYDNFKVEVEEFYKNNSEDIWVKCSENEARRVIPSEHNYALGLFMFRKRTSPT